MFNVLAMCPPTQIPDLLDGIHSKLEGISTPQTRTGTLRCMRTICHQYLAPTLTHLLNKPLPWDEWVKTIYLVRVMNYHSFVILGVHVMIFLYIQYSIHCVWLEYCTYCSPWTLSFQTAWLNTNSDVFNIIVQLTIHVEGEIKCEMLLSVVCWHIQYTIYMENL